VAWGTGSEKSVQSDVSPRAAFVFPILNRLNRNPNLTANHRPQKKRFAAENQRQKTSFPARWNA